MTHVRTLNRDRAAEALAGIPGLRGAYRSRVWPSASERLPCALVYFPSESVEVAAGSRPGHRVMKRLQVLRVVGVFSKPGSVDDTLEDAADAFVAEVEARLSGLGALRAPDGKSSAGDLRLSTVETGFDGSSASNLLLVSLAFLTTVHHPEGDPGTNLFARS